MANEINNDNIILVNAPAGSGKTYRIKSEIRDYVIDNPTDKVLCITYTNRAANELINEIDSMNVYVSTIHSYINHMISPLLGKKEIIDLYFEIYTDDILKRIENPKKSDSNERYKEKYGDINIDIIKKNIKYITYNEMKNNSLYYGGLGHDDILSFTYKILDIYPKLYEKINRRFKLIIIDEYQDTSPEVLNMFFNAVEGKDVKLYLYGDKMQQIYKLYGSELNEKLLSKSTDKSKIFNHRSAFNIVDILNNIYNNQQLKQQYSDYNKKIIPEYMPRVVIAKSTEIDYIVDKCTTQDEKTLVLYILNKERFEQIGSINLYNAYSKIEKYSYGRKTSVIDILLENNSLDNEDDLLSLMIIMYNVNYSWQNKIYGSFLKICRENKKIFNIKYLTFNSNADKKYLYDLWNAVFDKFNDPNATIEELIILMNRKELLEQKFSELLSDDNIYNDVFKVKIDEFIKLHESNLDTKVSTQHGVKGESHDSVLFIAKDNIKSEPRINMYDFFRVWSKIEFSLDDFENFHFEYMLFCKSFEEEIGFDLKNIKKNQLEEHKTLILQKSAETLGKFNENEIFNKLCREPYELYINKQTCTNAKACFKYSTIEKVLSAYKLFYVGCSRARKNLTIFVDEEKIKEFNEEFKQKIIKVGFEIIDSSEI